LEQHEKIEKKPLLDQVWQGHVEYLIYFEFLAFASGFSISGVFTMSEISVIG
jgi:hypothetical protein